MRNFSETLYDAYAQEFRVDELLHEVKTEHHHLVIFKNAVFGRVMALDGIVQTTQKDEFIYHEMMSHVPILAHGDAGKVLIVGGGDGGMLREVCRHASVREIVQVEIDRAVIDMCRKHLPGHSDGAYDDPRAAIVIDDGINFVRNTDERFDVIISDSTDPIGPGEALFTAAFYEGCKRCLNPGGILVTQNGVAFHQLDEIQQTAGRLRTHFHDWHFYAAAVPTYVGGIMCFAWASDDPRLRQTDLGTLRERCRQSGITTRYYNPEIHHAAFALPEYVLKAVGKADNEYR